MGMGETLGAIPDLFGPLDAVALACLLLVQWLIGWRIENPPAARPSTHLLVAQQRRDWHRELPTRDNRIADVNVVASLRQGATFFASAAMIALGGGAALLGQSERLRGVASDLGAPVSQPDAVWEIKIIFALLLLAAAFLRFVWAIRIFGYAAVVMASIPDGDSAEGQRLASRAAELNILADRSFARGLRSVYFTLAAIGWFVGPVAMIAAAAIVAASLWRQEFLSDSRKVLSGADRQGETG